MKKYLIILSAVCIFFVVGTFAWTFFVFKVTLTKRIECVKPPEHDALIRDALLLLKKRDDGRALKNFETVLVKVPDNIDALWGKAEVLRRSRNYKESEAILNTILSANKAHVPSLLSLAYIRYKDGKFPDGVSLINHVLNMDCVDKEDTALAYILLGTINSKYATEGGFLNKVKYGTRIKGYFIKANKLSPGMSEGHLALGTFYLLAPPLVGGNVNKAIKELEAAFEIAPEFATVNARLAQAYRMQGKIEKSNFYLNRAKQIDPGNEVLKEIAD
jgi:tetratricopeptide (TPR) repeat protein